MLIHKQLDFILREKTVISVVAKDGSSSFIGEDSYTDTYGNTRNLRTNPYFWPVFLQGGDDQLYRCMIKLYEPYKNNLTNKTDSVPTTEGTLKIANDLAEESFAEINVADFASLDSFRNLIYTFKPGFPNFNENVAIPEYSYTGKIEMILETAAGTVNWLPASFQFYQYNCILPEVHFDIVPAALGDDAPLWGALALTERSSADGAH